MVKLTEYDKVPVGGRRASVQVSMAALRELYRDAVAQLEHFLGYEPESTEALQYLAQSLVEEGKASGSWEQVGEEISRLLGVSYEPGVGMVASSRKALGPTFKEGDRVRLTNYDFYSGIPEGAEGTVGLIYGFHGRSPYPDPARRLLFVNWDEHGQVSVPKGMVERIRPLPPRRADRNQKWLGYPQDLLRGEEEYGPRPQEEQPFEGGEDGPSQESKRGGLKSVPVRRLV